MAARARIQSFVHARQALHSTNYMPSPLKLGKPQTLREPLKSLHISGSLEEPIGAESLGEQSGRRGRVIHGRDCGYTKKD